MDLEIIENGDGGDLIKTPNDMSVIYGFENMVYLALFGGCVEQDTPAVRNTNQQAFDFWGNSLLMPNDSSIQFNSKTERALNTIALSSSGRKQIEQAVKDDLQFMGDFANVKVSVAITGVDRVEIRIKLQQPGSLQKQEFIFIWDATKQELTQRELVYNNTTTIVSVTGIFDFTFDDSFS
jgi:hypothetical protein